MMIQRMWHQVHTSVQVEGVSTGTSMHSHGTRVQYSPPGPGRLISWCTVPYQARLALLASQGPVPVQKPAHARTGTEEHS